MTRAFSLLLVFLLVHSQAWAISGEPIFQVNNLTYSGTYAGVVIPVVGDTAQYSTGVNADGSTSSTGGSGTGVPGSGGTGSTTTSSTTDGLFSLTEDERAQLGLFSFAQPLGSGSAQGYIAMFVGGTIYTGLIEGLLNPKNGKLNGMITATSQFSQDSDVYTSGFGTIRARIKNYTESGLATAGAGTSTVTSAGNRVAAQVVGSVTLRLFDPSSDTTFSTQRSFGLKYKIEGWQQSFGTAVPAFNDIF
ncbi:MAG: hypothetical protein RLZZ253_773 [Verrucomicrobiota bacterium]|jgi:hypothetical protein